jgi:hypothetical protein
MAFVCTLAGAYPDPEFSVDRGYSYVTVPIGYDDCEPLEFSIIVGLTKSGGGLTDYFFAIQKFNEITDEVEAIMSGTRLNSYFCKEIREEIFIGILHITDILLRHTSEREIYRHTFDINPPPKALAKHRRVSQVFQKCGYAVAESGPVYGVYSWYAVKMIP